MYSKIDARFWTDEKILTLTLDAKILMLYLLTSPHRNQIGCYVLPRGYAVEDLQMPYERFNAAWDELLATGMVVYDEKVRVILVRNFLRYNAIENPSQATSAANMIADLPKSDIYIEVIETLSMLNKDYLKDVIDALKNLCINLVPDTVPNTLSDTLPDTVPSTLPDTVLSTLPDTVPDTNNNNNNNNNNNISISPPNPLTGESEPESEKPKPRKRTLTAEQRERFALFWNAYPNQVGIGAAEKEWAKLSPSAELTEEIVAAVRTAKEKDHRFREARYTPRPANWIMNREWENKYSNKTRKNMSNNTLTQRSYTQDELSKMGNRIGVVTDDDESN